jgi:hypothetical protein
MVCGRILANLICDHALNVLAGDLMRPPERRRRRAGFVPLWLIDHDLKHLLVALGRTWIGDSEREFGAVTRMILAARHCLAT